MTDETLEEIETRLEAERDALARTLDRLGDGLAPETLRAEAAQAALSCGSGLGGTLWQVARQNPAGAILAGAGLALIVSGPYRTGADPKHASDTGAAARHPCHDTSARRLRAALHRGLDGLDPNARRRVLEARLAALRAQEAVEQDAGRPTSKLAGAVAAHPVAAASAALCLGALAAALLPRKDGKQDGLARRRDALMAGASAALARERAMCNETTGAPAAAAARNGPMARQTPR